VIQLRPKKPQASAVANLCSAPAYCFEWTMDSHRRRHQGHFPQVSFKAACLYTKKCRKGLSVSKLKPKKLRPPLWQISVRHRHTASSGPWIATGDGTTGTFHKSHSKRHACTQRSAETEADCQSIRNTGSTLQRGPKKRGMSFRPFSADKAWQLESLRIEVLSGQPCQSTVMACGFAFIDFCTSSEKSERYLDLAIETDNVTYRQRYLSVGRRTMDSNLPLGSSPLHSSSLRAHILHCNLCISQSLEQGSLTQRRMYHDRNCKFCSGTSNSRAHILESTRCIWVSLS